jgi:hypothetical protein
MHSSVLFVPMQVMYTGGVTTGSGQYCSTGRLNAGIRPSHGEMSIVQHYVEQGTVDLQSAFYSAGVVDETQFPEPVHEKADS